MCKVHCICENKIENNMVIFSKFQKSCWQKVFRNFMHGNEAPLQVCIYLCLYQLKYEM